MSTLQANNVTNVAGTNLPDNLLPVTASSWVNFNGTGVVAIRDSHNVSSVTDNGVGSYSINFTVPLLDANYGAAAMRTINQAADFTVGINTQSASSLGVFTTGNAAPDDTGIVTVVTFGGQ